MLIKPSNKLLESIATGSDHIPRIYFDGNNYVICILDAPKVAKFEVKKVF